jgi:uncharacterized membrane protein YoaK (UPF0700 family)
MILYLGCLVNCLAARAAVGKAHFNKMMNQEDERMESKISSKAANEGEEEVQHQQGCSARLIFHMSGEVREADDESPMDDAPGNKDGKDVPGLVNETQKIMEADYNGSSDDDEASETAQGKEENAISKACPMPPAIITKNDDEESMEEDPVAPFDEPPTLEQEEQVVVEEKTNHHPFIGSPYTRQEYAYAICVGDLLSFNAGYVNGSCLSGWVVSSGTQRAVTSHTGTTTKSALALANGDMEEFGFLVSMLLCFVLGSFLAGSLTPKPTPFRIEPTYGPTFLMGATLLTLSSLLAALETDHEQFIFYLASGANGIQNGISSMYSKNLIRSTGITGTSTDIGIFVGQFLRGNRKNTWRLLVLLFLWTSFWSGGLVSLYATAQFIHLSLLLNAGLFLLIGGSVVAFLMLELDVSLLAAVLGTWHWSQALDKLAQHTTEISETQPDYDDDNADIMLASQRRLDAVFDRIDTDHSNSIDLQELHVALKEIGIKISKRECAAMMKRADSDRNGTISRTEWHEIAQSCCQSSSSSSQRSRPRWRNRSGQELSSNSAHTT